MSDMIEVDTTDMRTTASPAVKDKWETWCDPITNCWERLNSY